MVEKWEETVSAILMVKNSRSFELTKIRHFRDRPYRGFYKTSKGRPPKLPVLRKWVDNQPMSATPESAPLLSTAVESPEADVATIQKQSETLDKLPKTTSAKSAIPTARPASRDAVMAISGLKNIKAQTVKPPRKKLALAIASLGTAGENCDLREVLDVAEAIQKEDFDHMNDALPFLPGKAPKELDQAQQLLTALQNKFGDDGNEG